MPVEVPGVTGSEVERLPRLAGRVPARGRGAAAGGTGWWSAGPVRRPRARCSGRHRPGRSRGRGRRAPDPRHRLAAPTSVAVLHRLADEPVQVRTLAVDGSPRGLDDLSTTLRGASAALVRCRWPTDPLRRDRTSLIDLSDAERGDVTLRPAGRRSWLRRLSAAPQPAPARGLERGPRLLDRRVPGDLLAACPTPLADLLLGGRCVGCGPAGPGLCRRLRGRRCPARPRPAWPTPTPAGLAAPWAAAAYDGAVRAMVLAHKERPAARPAAAAGRAAGAAAVGRDRRPRPVVLVPVPSRPGDRAGARPRPDCTP